MPRHLLEDQPAPSINLPVGASTEQVIVDGIRPLHQWGAEGWARIRQIRQLQQECGKSRN